jgi:hypothetical protein
VVERMMAREPDDHYQSAIEPHVALKEALETAGRRCGANGGGIPGRLGRALRSGLGRLSPGRRGRAFWSDVEDDGKVDISDAVAILGFLFLGEADPPATYDSDSLTCAAYRCCGQLGRGFRRPSWSGGEPCPRASRCRLISRGP